MGWQEEETQRLLGVIAEHAATALAVAGRNGTRPGAADGVERCQNYALTNTDPLERKIGWAMYREAQYSTYSDRRGRFSFLEAAADAWNAASALALQRRAEWERRTATAQHERPSGEPCDICDKEADGHCDRCGRAICEGCAVVNHAGIVCLGCE